MADRGGRAGGRGRGRGRGLDRGLDRDRRPDYYDPRGPQNNSRGRSQPHQQSFQNSPRGYHVGDEHRGSGAACYSDEGKVREVEIQMGRAALSGRGGHGSGPRTGPELTKEQKLELARKKTRFGDF